MKENSLDISKSNTGSITMLLAMVVIGVVCAILIAMTFEFTLPIIEKNKAEALEAAIFRVIPGISSTRTYQLDQDNKFVLSEPGNKSDKQVYAGYNDKNELIGVAIEASGQGYADIIKILYGYKHKSQKVIGFYVLESKETPGLGDKIEKDNRFLANFENLDLTLNGTGDNLENDVVTVKQGKRKNLWEIDGITGATISSRAIGDIINFSAKYWVPILERDKDLLLINEKELELQ